MLLCTYTSKSVHTNACNKQSDVCYLSYFHVHTAINILRCFGYPKEHNFGLVLILNPTGCTEGCVYFPQSCRNTHLPHFLHCLLNTTLIPCLLVFFLSILHERLIQRSTKFGIKQAYCALASYPGPFEKRAWYPLFAHALNFPTFREFRIIP